MRIAALLGERLGHLDHLLVRDAQLAHGARRDRRSRPGRRAAAPPPSPRPGGRARRSARAPGPGRCWRRRRAAAPGSAPGRWCGCPSCCAWRGPWISTACPSTRISPESLASEPLRIFISVDLPAPFSPSRTCTSPGAHLQVHAVEGEHSGKGFPDRLHVQAGAAASSGLTDAVRRAGERWSARTTRRGGEDHAPRLLAVVVHALEERAQRQLAHLEPRLVDRGQRDVAEGGQRRVVVADQRDVVRNLEAALLDRVERADGGQVVGGEDRGRPRAVARAGRGTPLCPPSSVYVPARPRTRALPARGASWPPRTRGGGRGRRRPGRRRCGRCGDGRARRSARRRSRPPRGRRW